MKYDCACPKSLEPRFRFLAGFTSRSLACCANVSLYHYEHHTRVTFHFLERLMLRNSVPSCLIMPSKVV